MVTRMSPQASAETAKIRLTRKSAAYWVATFNNPPLNRIPPTFWPDAFSIANFLHYSRNSVSAF
jgi:hypothetical protein